MAEPMTMELARQLRAQDCPLPALAGPAIKLLFDRIEVLEATLRQQAGRVDEGEGFDPRKFVRNLTDVLEAGGGMFKIDDDLARLGAAIQAALAQNTQGEGEPVAFDYPEFHAKGMGCGLEDRGITDRYEAMRYGWDDALDQMARVIDSMGPLYTHAERAMAPEGWTMVPQLFVDKVRASAHPDTHHRAVPLLIEEAMDELEDAAPSQPKDAGEVGHG